MMKLVLLAAALITSGAVFSADAFDFDDAWKRCCEAIEGSQPRSATNVLAEIEREAIAAKRWPFAVKAFALRVQQEQNVDDSFATDWIPAAVAEVESAPEEMRPYLDLYLARLYVDNSRPWRWGGRRPTKLTDAAAAEKLPAWSPERLPASLEALFTRVLAAADRLKAEPVGNWDAVIIPGTLPDSCRPTLYDLAVHYILDFYGETVPDKTLEKGLKLIDELIAFHQNDTNLDARADAELSRLQYRHAFAELPQAERDARYAEALDEFIGTYFGKSEVGTIALERRARMMWQAGDGVRARELALKGVARMQTEECGGRACAALVEQIEAPDVRFETERVWSEPFAPVTVSARNTDRVFFKLAPLSYEDFVNDDWNARDRIRDAANAAKPVRTWSVGLPHYDDYAEHVESAEVPSGLAPGYYCLFAGLDDRFNATNGPFYAEKVMVSDIALVTACGDGCYAGTVFTSKDGARVAGAKVELWGSKEWDGPQELLATDWTGPGGDFSIKDQQWRQCRLRVFAGGSEAVSDGSLWPGGVGAHRMNPNRTEVVTDRAIYRPGQTIRFKGYAAHVDPYERVFRVLPDSRVSVELYDPNRQNVAALTLTANEWGSFIGEFTAPRDRLTGCYRIRSRVVDGGSYSEAKVFVEEYKRPKFSAEIGRAPADAALGREVELAGKASAYSGIPVEGAKVKWSVARTTRYPRWWRRWFGRSDGVRQVAQGETVTDADGAFRIRFTPVAAPTADLSGEPSFLFEIKADVTDTTGETRSVETRCEIGTVAWRAEVTAPDGAAPDERVSASVALASLDGTRTSARGTLSVYRLKGPAAPVRKPLDGYRQEEPGEWDWHRWPNGEAVKTMSVEVTDGAWKGALDGLPAGAYRMVFETKDPVGKTVTGRAEFAVIDYAAEQLGFAAPDYFVLRQGDGGAKVGAKLSIVWASGYAGGYGRVEVFSNGERVLCRDTAFAKPFIREEYEVRKSDRGTLRVRTTFFREGRLYVNDEHVTVPWDDKELSIVPMHLTSKLETGAKETWSFKVSGESEVLAFMYDRSLDAFLKHDAAFPFRDFSIPDAPRPYPVLANGRRGLGFAGGTMPLSGGHVPVAGRSLEFLFRSSLFVTMDDAEGKEVFHFIDSPVRMRAVLGSRSPGIVGCAYAGAAAAEHVEPTVEVRKRLEETAFFQPQLVTDEEGRFSVTFTAPEAISGWKFVAIAHDQRLRSGIYTNDSITTTRPLTVEPNAPRFVREGDDFEFAVKVTNNSDGPETATVSLEFENLATLTPAKVGGGVRKVELKPHESRSVMFKVGIPDGQDYLKYTAKAVGAKFADGEEGTLAVLSRRIEVREAVQLNVRGKATKTFALTNLVDSVKNGDTIRNVELSVRVVSRPAWYAVASLPYLMEFPHECCEQTFGRHYANQLAAYIAASDPRIRAMFEGWRSAGADALKSPLELNDGLKAVALEATPWIREAAGETAARKRMGVLFDRERVESESRLALDKLKASLTGSALLPWFPGGPSSPHVSLYAAIGFARLERLAGVRRPDWSWRLVAALDAFEKDDVARRLDWCGKNDAEFRMSGFDIRWLYLHSFPEFPAGDGETDMLLKEHLEKEWPDFSVEGKALAAIVLHRGGSAASAGKIMKSLKEHAVVSEEFGMYYKRDAFFSSGVFASPVSAQTAVVEAFKEVANDQETVDALNVWILKQKETQAWNTTASTADAIYALLIGSGTDLLAGDELATVTLGGVEVPKNDAEAGTGAYAAGWRGSDVKPEMGKIVLKGVREKGVVWGGVNWTYLEDVDKVRSFEPEELRIEKRYFRKIRTSEGARLEPVKGVLEQGDELVARLSIRADRTFEFVHIQDERPSTAEPVDVLSKYRWQDGVGYYQSTRDAATHYYIDRLNKGEFVLETSYRVQQRGVFSGGLARIQCMYAPEFTAHSTSEKVEVK